MKAYLAKKEEKRTAMEQQRIKLLWQTAMYDATLQKDNLRICWSPLKHIDPVLYTYHSTFGSHLKCLRLIGIELVELPSELGTELPLLEILSLENNKLTYLPDTITLLTHLKELNLVYNQLVRLPDRIGFMASLRRLDINNNQLEALPITFGALNQLQRLDIECNRIQQLPENLDNMILCQSINVNRNQLKKLPRCVGRMPSLTSISATNNKLTFLPQELFNSKTIKIIRLSMNELSTISEHIGEMIQLEELSIDYNQIKSLPVTLYKLDNLRILRVEGNEALVDPPPEILTQGAKRVVQYCREHYIDDKFSRMKFIIMTTINVLQQIEERNIYDSAFFEPEAYPVNESTAGEPIPASKDRYFALQLKYFFDDLLPRMQLIWNQMRFREAYTDDLVTNFPFAEKEVMWAWSNYRDAHGPVLLRDKALFRRCKCESTCCVPMRPGFQCMRDCLLLKKNIVRRRDREERLWLAYKQQGILDAVKRAEAEARAFLASKEGKQWIEVSAFEKAEDFLLDIGVTKVVEHRLRNIEQRKQRVAQRTQREMQQLEKARDEKLAGLQEELKKLKETRKLTREGYMKNVIEARIDELVIQMATLPEIRELKLMQKHLEEELAQIEEEAYVSSSEEDRVSLFDEDAEGFSSDDSTEEAQRWRRTRDRYRQRQAQKELAAARKQRLREEREKQRRERKALRVVRESAENETLLQTLGKVVRAVGQAAESRLYKPVIEPAIEDGQRRLQRAARKTRRLLRDVREISFIRVQKFRKMLAGDFNEAQRELKYELCKQYIDHQMRVAREKARREFYCIERVRDSVRGQSLEKSFIAWKKWVWTKQQRFRRDLKRRFKLAVRGFHAAIESVRSAQMQVEMWRAQHDVLTGQRYFCHLLSGAKTFETPALRHYLPPNFKVPDSPPSLPPELADYILSNDHSESEDSTASLRDWQRKYGKQRNAYNLAHQLRAFKQQEKLQQTSGPAMSAAEKHNLMLKQLALDVADENFDGHSNFNQTDQTLPDHASQSSESETESAGDGQLASVNATMQTSMQSSHSLDRTAPVKLPPIGSPSASERRDPAGHTTREPAGQSVQPRSQQEILQSEFERAVAWATEYLRRHPEVMAGHTPSIETFAASLQSDGQLDQTLPAPSDSAEDIQRLLREKKARETAEKKLQLAKYNADLQRRQRELEYQQRQQQMVLEHASDSRVSFPSFNFEDYYDEQGELIDGFDEPLVLGHQYQLSGNLSRLPDLPGSAGHWEDHRGTPLDVVAEHIQQKADLEYERSYKIIRKRRNQFNPVRQQTYMHQAHRKLRSFEELQVEARERADAEKKMLRSLQGLGEEEVAAAPLSAEELERRELLRRIEQPEELLDMAGGQREMIHTGKAGLGLRTILAHRALLIKRQTKAAVTGKKKTFFQREIAPLFMHKYEGSSSEEEDEEAIAREREKRREERREERRQRRLVRAKVEEQQEFQQQQLRGVVSSSK